jgi:hypothetical protein
MGLPKGAFFGTVPYLSLRGARVKVCALSALCALRSVGGPSWPLSAVSPGIAQSASHATECVFRGNEAGAAKGLRRFWLRWAVEG